MTEENLIFSKIKKKYLNFLRKQEVLGQPFYDKLGQFKNFYIPICNSIYKKFTKNKLTCRKTFGDQCRRRNKNGSRCKAKWCGKYDWLQLY